MNTQLADPAAALLPPPLDAKTIQNWAGSTPLPEDVPLDCSPANLDLEVAERVRQAINRLPGVGDRFAGFDLVAVLGRGTFGRVYLARQGELAERYVALKVSTDLTGESRTLARLQHTNIVPIYSVHRVYPFQAVCMPFFGATTLGHLLARYRGESPLPSTGRQLVDTLCVLNDETDVSPPAPASAASAPSQGGVTEPTGTEPAQSSLFPTRTGSDGFLRLLRDMTYPDAVCWIGARLADGLAHAHAHGLVHNDLKPANVLLTDEGQPMLLDFGVADDLAVRAVTPPGTIGGTFPYMSPEHLESTLTRTPITDPRSDIYALGIILFEMLTGRHPFRLPSGKLDDEVPRMISDRKAGAPRLRPLNAAVTPGLEAIVRKCLDPDPARRYSSAADLRDDLDRHRDNQALIHTRVPSIRERLRKWTRRNPHLTSNLSLTVVALILAGLCATGLYARGQRIARYEATTAARELEDDLNVARYLLTARAPDAETVRTGIERCETALARYGLPDDPAWETRSAFQALPPDEQQKVRDRLTEVCVFLARGYALRANPVASGGELLERATELNVSAERVAGDEVPRAVWDQRAALLWRKGDTAGAEQSAARGKTASLRSGRDFYLSGSESLSAGRYQEARDLLTRAIELSPSDYWGHIALGVTYEGLGKYTDAVGCYSTAIALTPEMSRGYHNRGLANLKLRDFRKAQQDLSRAVELAPEHGDTYLNLALANQGLRDYPAALKDLDRAVEAGAPRARVAFMRARIHELAGDKVAAKRVLDEAMRQEPTDEVTWIARGIARLGTDLPGALADFEAAAAANPRSLAALQNKSHVLSKLGKTAEAITTLNRVIELYPDFVPGRAGRGVMHGRAENWAAAKADAEEALRRDPSPSNMYQVAGIYALLTKQDPAHKANAIRLLTAALRGGFGYDYIEDDKDLAPIRNTPEYKRVLEGVHALKAGR